MADWCADWIPVVTQRYISRSANDQAAKRYNQYLQLHGETLKKAGRKYTNLQPLPLFELQL